jgi:hypothetical protein
LQNIRNLQSQPQHHEQINNLSQNSRSAKVVKPVIQQKLSSILGVIGGGEGKREGSHDGRRN